jgi:hypothetical protein
MLLGFPSFVELLLSWLMPEALALIPPVMLRWSWSGWILWSFILSRFIGLNHPPTVHDHSLSMGRVVYGWVAIAIFVITFTPVPFGVT